MDKMLPGRIVRPVQHAFSTKGVTLSTQIGLTRSFNLVQKVHCTAVKSVDWYMSIYLGGCVIYFSERVFGYNSTVRCNKAPFTWTHPLGLRHHLVFANSWMLNSDGVPSGEARLGVDFSQFWKIWPIWFLHTGRERSQYLHGIRHLLNRWLDWNSGPTSPMSPCWVFHS